MKFVGNTFKHEFFEIEISKYFNSDDDSYLRYNIYFWSPCFDEDDVRDNITLGYDFEDARDHINLEYDFEVAIKFINAEDAFYLIDKHHFKTKLLPKDFEIRLWCSEEYFFADLYFKDKKVKSFDTIEDAIKHVNGNSDE